MAGNVGGTELRANFKDCVGLPGEIGAQLENDVFMGKPEEPLAMADLTRSEPQASLPQRRECATSTHRAPHRARQQRSPR